MYKFLRICFSEFRKTRIENFINSDYLNYSQEFANGIIRIFGNNPEMEILTGVVDEIDHKIISIFNRRSTIDRNSP